MLTVDKAGTEKYLIHSLPLKLLLGHDKVLPLHCSEILGFLSKVLINVNTLVSSQSMCAWAAGSLEPVLQLQ